MSADYDNSSGQFPKILFGFQYADTEFLKVSDNRLVMDNWTIGINGTLLFRRLFLLLLQHGINSVHRSLDTETESSSFG